MNNKFKPENHPELYHYTSMDSLYSGIISNEGDLCFWASNVQFLNDPTETERGIDLVSNIITELNIPISKFNREKLLENFFSLSLSLCSDNLPMWSMYGGKGNGIMLILNSHKIVNRGCIVNHMRYDNPEEIESLKKGLNKIWTEGEHLDDLFRISDNSAEKKLVSYIKLVDLPIIIKSSAYQYEKEVRVSKTKPLLILENEVKYRHSNGLIIPYIEIRFPKEALTHIMIGPTNDFERSKYSLEMFLASKGFDHVEVIQSKVPYRG